MSHSCCEFVEKAQREGLGMSRRRLQKREKPLSIKNRGGCKLSPDVMAYAKMRDEHSLRAKVCLQKGRGRIVAQSWWVILFVSICGLVYFNSISKKNAVLAVLDQHLRTLNGEKASLLQEKEDLLLQINSQSDPAWIRLTLMKGLGLVPEGQLKVYFYSDDN